ncbi:hypothetical protein B0H16DRAFT_1887281 [Mycena metata]|uniref:Uncharacterized protein n=1 Tax=Mycena metata TaxID=1033252 RepID=A0AAD7IX44_9AGAR|nr:hypothetical protein B0H16DRAFT_1887281 [Mycena metata]
MYLNPRRLNLTALAETQRRQWTKKAMRVRHDSRIRVTRGMDRDEKRLGTASSDLHIPIPGADLIVDVPIVRRHRNGAPHVTTVVPTTCVPTRNRYTNVPHPPAPATSPTALLVHTRLARRAPLLQAYVCRRRAPAYTAPTAETISTTSTGASLQAVQRESPPSRTPRRASHPPSRDQRTTPAALIRLEDPDNPPHRPDSTRTRRGSLLIIVTSVHVSAPVRTSSRVYLSPPGLTRGSGISSFSWPVLPNDKRPRKTQVLLAPASPPLAHRLENEAYSIPASTRAPLTHRSCPPQGDPLPIIAKFPRGRPPPSSSPHSFVEKTPAHTYHSTPPPPALLSACVASAAANK